MPLWSYITCIVRNITNKLSYLTLLVTTIWRQNTKHEMQHGWNGDRKPRSARFGDEFLKSRPRYACQPIDIAWGNYLLNRLQNFKSLAYHTLADCRPFHPVQVECFQGTGVCLNCSTHTSTPRSDEAFESHATGLDQTWQSKEVCHASHNCTFFCFSLHFWFGPM